MGAIARLDETLARMHGKRVYFDTAPIIYALENAAQFAEVSIPFIYASENRKIIGFTGAVTLAEMLVKPLQQGNAEYADVLKGLFACGDLFDCVDHTREAYVLAATLRAEHRYKFVDALQIATARTLGCQFFITNDHKLASSPLTEVVCVQNFLAEATPE